MRQFLKSSFANGNRYTNITVTIIMLLLTIIAFFLKDIYADFKDMKKEINIIQINAVQLQQRFDDHVNLPKSK